MSPSIILIETSTSLCSVALLEGDSVTARRFSSEPRAHAAMTAPYVKEVLDERGMRVSDCDAVCLSMGPGSYTGLRVGSSTAKGLCFGGGIPLLAVSTLDVLVAQARAAGLPDGCRYIVPMIDARRMEVYTAIYTSEGERLTEIAPIVVDSLSSFDSLPLRDVSTPGYAPEGKCPLGDKQGEFSPTRREGPVGSKLSPSDDADDDGRGRSELCERSSLRGRLPKLAAADGVMFIGDGVAKCEEVLAGPGRWFRQECPRADAMVEPALREWRAAAFRDTAYFEPFYLKDFIATTPKKLF